MSSDKVQTILNGKPEVLTGLYLLLLCQRFTDDVAIVKHRTHKRGQLGDLYITSFSLPNTVNIAIHPPPSKEERDIELTFDPPVKDAYEVRERMFEWRDKAFEHFDVVSLSYMFYS